LTDDFAWREAVLAQLNNSVKNISGEERANLILGWHGGCPVPYKVAANNFLFDENEVKKTDGGYFGNGIYFTQFLSYSDKYMKLKEKQHKIVPGAPLILSWVLMGNAYPVIEKATVKGDPNSLFGCSRKDGYVCVKDIDPSNPNNLVYQPCNPLVDTPDYDEVVVFSKKQVLPRYLVYYSRIDAANNNVFSLLK